MSRPFIPLPLLCAALLFATSLTSCRSGREDRLTPVSFEAVVIDDDFWSDRLYRHMKFSVPVFVERIESQAAPTGDLKSKALEGIAYSLFLYPDPVLQARLDGWTAGKAFDGNGEVVEIGQTFRPDSLSSVGRFLWNFREILSSGDGKYADEMERSLYNGVLAGMSLKGDKFYQRALQGPPDSPVDIFRLIPSIGGFLYAESGKALWVNQYMCNEARVSIAGKPVRVQEKTTFPWDGDVALRLNMDKPVKGEIRLRVPSWSRDYSLSVNGNMVNDAPMDKGYAVLAREWADGDEIELILDMSVRMVAPDPGMKESEGKSALWRGPLLYCLEEEDNPGVFDSITLPPDASFAFSWEPKKLYGIMEIRSGDLTFVPYYASGNRGPGKTLVFIPHED
ncbi:MAG: glycoside hydrolase family 127 protein [Bacteroidales bacterium]|nr:glycoside hydrolase family 127 protein [Bacteroidales bacterium]